MLLWLLAISGQYARHPLVFLVEAADDICYQMMDIEDAHKLKLLTTEEVKKLYTQFFDEGKKKRGRADRGIPLYQLAPYCTARQRSARSEPRAHRDVKASETAFRDTRVPAF